MPLPKCSDSFALNENRFLTILSASLNKDGKTWTVTAEVAPGTIAVDSFGPAKDYIPVVGQAALFRRTANGMFIMRDYPPQTKLP